MVEEPDSRATVDFLGKYGAIVRMSLEGDKLRVEVMGCDDRSSILLDEVLTVPEADERR
jgi:hypothetical protein